VDSPKGDTVSTQKATDSLDLDWAADDTALRRIILEDRHRKLGFELVSKPTERL